MEKLRKFIPPYVLLLSIIIGAATSTYYPLRLIPYPYNLIGIPFILFGLYIMIWANRIFREKSTPVNPNHVPTVLVFDGPYRFTRNPMYFGILSILDGTAIFSGNVSFFAASVIFFAWISVVFIPYEEKKLEKLFGKAYLDYKKKVRRWV